MFVGARSQLRYVCACLVTGAYFSARLFVFGISSKFSTDIGNNVRTRVIITFDVGNLKEMCYFSHVIYPYKIKIAIVCLIADLGITF